MVSVVGHVQSVNVGQPKAMRSKSGVSAIDKRPVDGPVRIDVPGPGCSGLDGDAICDVRVHGGPEAAVYAYAREDLDRWQVERPEVGVLADGAFGENLTTVGVDVTGARVGERWRIGGVLLQVTDPRVPCAVFAEFLHQAGWIKTFTARAIPGAYLKVLEPGLVRAGDAVVREHVPGHDVTIGVLFRALTREPDLFGLVLTAGGDLPAQTADRARRRFTFSQD